MQRPLLQNTNVLVAASQVTILPSLEAFLALLECVRMYSFYPADEEKNGKESDRQNHKMVCLNLKKRRAG